MEPMHTSEVTEWLPIGEAARLMGISVDTLRRWANEDRIPVVVLPSGVRRFRRADIDALIGKASAS